MNEQIIFPDEYTLEIPSYELESPTDPAAVEFCKARKALLEKARAGKLFIKFVNGDRKGSIARVVLDPQEHIKTFNEDCQIIYCRVPFTDTVLYKIDNPYFFGVAKWDKRKNSCEVHFPSRDIVFLPNYDGPTVYEMFDKKAAKEDLLKDPNQLDVDGKKLEIGDKVLYINARYGSGFTLCHGTIVEFKATVHLAGHYFTTVIKNDHVDEVSSITITSEMVWKK